MLFCVVLRYAQPKMLAFDGCLVQAMDCRIVRKSIMAVGFFFEVGWSAFGAAARQEKQKVCIAACMHVSAIAFACARQKTKKKTAHACTRQSDDDTMLEQSINHLLF